MTTIIETTLIERKRFNKRLVHLLNNNNGDDRNDANREKEIY